MKYLSKKWMVACLLFLTALFVWAENPYKYSESLYMWGEPDERDVDSMMQKFKDLLDRYTIEDGVFYTLQNDYSRRNINGSVYQTIISVTINWGEETISIEAQAFNTEVKELYPFVFELVYGYVTPEIRNYNSFRECSSFSAGINIWLAQVLSR